MFNQKLEQTTSDDKSHGPDGHCKARFGDENDPIESPKNRLRLTGHTARRTKTPKRDTILWDRDIPGFGLRWRTSGTKSWIVRYQLRGRIQFVTLGKPPTMTALEARKRARKLRGEANLVGLPVAPKQSSKPELTLADFVDQFLAASKGRWKKSTLAGNARIIRVELIPLFGEQPLAAICKADVARWRDSMASRSGSFNRAVPVLSAMLREAENFGHRPKGSNPTKGIPRYKRALPERYLSPAEYRVLGEVLRDAEVDMPLAVPIIRLLLYTGARVNEVAGLRCEWVKPPRLMLPDSKTGPRVIYLNEPAREVLTHAMDGKERGLVFPATRKPSKPFNPSPHWRILRGRAGLSDVRLHDLRHSFASLAIRDGVSLNLIGRLLGHALPESTERYTHLADDVVSEAADRVCASIAAGLGMTA
ncbi:site-specific integrase [Sphingomonadaceae bacterium]|nr:site-specific integrase [Sphingomonadaceae bacterium]